MKDAVQGVRRNLYTLEVPHGLVLSKQDHESAHVTSKGQNVHGGSCLRIVPWDSVKSKELPQDAQPWQEKGCSPAHITLSLQSFLLLHRVFPSCWKDKQDPGHHGSHTVFHSCPAPTWHNLVLPHAPGTQRLPAKEKEQGNVFLCLLLASRLEFSRANETRTPFQH